jgi:hypothetical protein
MIFKDIIVYDPTCIKKIEVSMQVVNRDLNLKLKLSLWFAL